MKSLLKRHGVHLHDEGMRAQSVAVPELRDHLSAFCAAVDEKAERAGRDPDLDPA